MKAQLIILLMLAGIGYCENPPAKKIVPVQTVGKQLLFFNFDYAQRYFYTTGHLEFADSKEPIGMMIVVDISCWRDTCDVTEAKVANAWGGANLIVDPLYATYQITQWTKHGLTAHGKSGMCSDDNTLSVEASETKEVYITESTNAKS